jgi:hypothetical protein
MIEYMEENNHPVENYRSLVSVIETNTQDWHRSRTLLYEPNKEAEKDLFNPHRDVNILTVFSKDMYIKDGKRHSLVDDNEAGYYIQVES